jgi:rare lipoprotein A
MKASISIDPKWILLAAASLMLGACAIHSGPARPGYDRDMGQYPEKTEPREAGSVQEGMISFYADKFHGRKTASGARFDKNALTAAHRSLPFRTMVEVTNLENGKTVTVEINDRGPYSKNRILDLSPAAARKIGLGGQGTVRAKVVVQ